MRLYKHTHTPSHTHQVELKFRFINPKMVVTKPHICCCHQKKIAMDGGYIATAKQPHFSNSVGIPSAWQSSCVSQNNHEKISHRTLAQ